MRPLSTSGRRRANSGETPSEPHRGDAAEIGAPPISIRWYRSRHAGSKRRGSALTYWVPVVARGKGRRAARLSVLNTYPRRGPARKLLEAAIREALAGCDGSWKARVAGVKACRMDIAGPDRSRWIVFIPNPERQSFRALTAHLVDACRRPRLVQSGRSTREAIVVLVGEP
jgi:hypothetical protein